MQLHRFLFPLLIFSLPTGCLGTETGNPDVAELELRFISTEPERIGLQIENDSPKQELSIHEAVLRPSSLSFHGCDGVVIDLDLGASTLESPFFTELAAGEYCRITALFSADAATASSADILSFNGLRGSDAVEIYFNIRESWTLDTVAESPVVIRAKSRLVLGLDFAVLIAPGQTADLASNQQNATLVDPNNNEWLYQQIKIQLPASVKLYQDTNSDGTLSPAELDQPLF